MFWVTTVLTWLGNLLGGPFAKAAVEAYGKKLAAENTSERVAADLAARELAVEQREQEQRTQLLIAEQGNWLTRWVRPAFALPFIIFTFKVVVWDKVLGLGRTDPLDPNMWGVFTTIVACYFGGRTIEKVATILKRNSR